MQTRLIVLFVMLLLLWPAVAVRAASFDCEAATTAFERAICGDPELSDRDEGMQTAYETALAGLSASARTVMQGNQRAWLRFAERACTEDAEPAAKPYDGEGVDCIKTLYADRLEVLESSRMLGGHRFYTMDQYQAVDALEEEGVDTWVEVATRTSSFPQIDGDEALAAAFNAAMSAQHATNLEQWGEGAEIDAQSDLSILTRPADVTAGRISSESTFFYYPHGAAHGMYGLHNFHFMIEEQRPVEPSDLFATPGWEKELASLAAERLEAELGDDLQMDKQTVLLAVQDPSRWSFTDRGLDIQFQPYEVAAYAVGAPTITVSWDQLGDLLAPEASALY